MPYFLSTTTIGKLQGALEGCIMFAANISFTALSTVGCLAKGILYGHNLIGGWLPVSILILIVWFFLSQCALLQRDLHFVLLNPQICQYD